MSGGAPRFRRTFFCHVAADTPGNRMRRLINGYYNLLTVLLGVSVALLVLPVTLQMIARFTALIPSWIWTEEMARFLFIWMVMLGAMIGVRDGTHFDVDLWPELAPRTNAMFRLVSTAFVLVFALILIILVIEFGRGSLRDKVINLHSKRKPHI